MQKKKHIDNSRRQQRRTNDKQHQNDGNIILQQIVHNFVQLKMKNKTVDEELLQKKNFILHDIEINIYNVHEHAHSEEYMKNNRTERKIEDIIIERS